MDYVIQELKGYISMEKQLFIVMATTTTEEDGFTEWPIGCYLNKQVALEHRQRAQEWADSNHNSNENPYDYRMQMNLTGNMTYMVMLTTLSDTIGYATHYQHDDWLRIA